MVSSKCSECVRICSNPQRVFNKKWADSVLKFGVRICHGYEWSIPRVRIQAVKYLIRFLRREGFEWYARRLELAFYHSLNTTSILFKGHREEPLHPGPVSKRRRRSSERPARERGLHD